MKPVLALTCLFSMLLCARAQQPGSINTAFGNNGYLHFNLDTLGAMATAFTRTSDGKYVIAGQIMRRCDSYPVGQIGVMRLNSDGTPDISFNSCGYKISGHSAYDYKPGGVAMDSYGSIFVAGTRTDICGGSPGNEQAFVQKLNSDGSVDGAFGNGEGIYMVPVGNGQSAGNDILIDNGNFLYVCGYKNNSGQKRAYVAKIDCYEDGLVNNWAVNGVCEVTTSNGVFVSMVSNGSVIYLAGYGANEPFVAAIDQAPGTPLASFGTGGVFLMDMGASNEYPYDIVSYNSKLYMCGYSSGQPFVASANLNGTANTSFDGDGKKVINLPDGSFHVGKSITAGGNGLFLLCDMGSNDYYKVVALELNGTYQTSFGSSGILTDGIAQGQSIQITPAAISYSGNGMFYILASPEIEFQNPPGQNNNPYKPQFGLKCIDEDGDPVNTYGGQPEKVILTNLSGENNARITMQGNKAIIATQMYNYSDENFYAVYRRHQMDGSIDHTFEAGSFGSFYTFSLYVYPDGKILFGGYEYDPQIGSSHIALYRLMPEGGPDMSFGVNGKVEKIIPGASCNLLDCDVDAAGNIYGTGNISDGSTDKTFVCKIMPTGIFDSNFDGDGIATVNNVSNNHGNPSGYIDASGNYVQAAVYYGSPALTADVYVRRFAPDGSVIGQPVKMNMEESATAHPFSLSGRMIAAAPGGKYYLASGFVDNSVEGTTLGRYKPDLTIDSTFGTNGFVRILDPVSYIYPNKLTVTTDGKPMLNYYIMDTVTVNEGYVRSVIHRFNTDGTDDAGFSFDGKVAIQNSTYTYVSDMAFTGDGRIYVTAISQPGRLDYDLMLLQIFTGVVGIDAVLPPDAIDLYPNPAGDFFRINTKDLLCKGILVMTLEGKTILTSNGEFTGMKEFNTGSVANGTYIVTLFTAKGMISKRVIVQR